MYLKDSEGGRGRKRERGIEKERKREREREREWFCERDILFCMGFYNEIYHIDS